MKTYYILILLLAFSSVNGHNNFQIKDIEFYKVAYLNHEEVILSLDDFGTISLIEEKDLPTIITRRSDIKMYLNFIRNVENIDLLFPKINSSVSV